MTHQIEVRHKPVRRTAFAAIAALFVAGMCQTTPASAAVPPEALNASRQGLAGYGQADENSYWTMAPGNNCTNYVAWRMIRNGMSPGVTWLHNGGDWAGEARAHKYPVNQSPAVGAVAQWSNGAPSVGSSGHVAYVEAVLPNAILVSEDNYSSGPRRVRLIAKSTPEWPTTFIHFVDHHPGQQSASEWKKFLADYAKAF